MLHPFGQDFMLSNFRATNSNSFNDTRKRKLSFPAIQIPKSMMSTLHQNTLKQYKCTCLFAKATQRKSGPRHNILGVFLVSVILGYFFSFQDDHATLFRAG